MAYTGITIMRVNHETMMDIVHEGLRSKYFNVDSNTPTPTDVERGYTGEFILHFEEEDDA